MIYQSVERYCLSFIPVFNFYCMFVIFHRLSLRLNEQLAIAGKRETVPTALGITGLALLFVPFVGWVSHLVLLPMFAGIVQSRINLLIEEKGQHSRVLHGHQQPAVAYPVSDYRTTPHNQVPQPMVAIRDEQSDSISLELY